MRPRIVITAEGNVVQYRLIGPAAQWVLIICVVLALLIWSGELAPSRPVFVTFGSLAVAALVILGTWVVTFSADGVSVDRLARSRSVAWGDIDRLSASSYRGSASLRIRTVDGQDVAVATLCDQRRILELLRLAAEQGLVPSWMSVHIAGHPPPPIHARDWPRLGDSFWAPLGHSEPARDRPVGRRR